MVSRTSPRFPPGFPLNLKGRDENPNIGKRHADCKVSERVLKRQAQALLLKGNSEFLADRIRQFLSDQLKAGCESMPGADSSSEKVHRFGKLFFELVEPSLAERARDNEGENATAVAQHRLRR